MDGAATQKRTPGINAYSIRQMSISAISESLL